MPVQRRIMLSNQYTYGCPNCGGRIDSTRLERGLPCKACLPGHVAKRISGHDRDEIIISVSKELRRLGSLKGYAYLGSVIEELKRFKSFFETVVGSPMLDAQETWALRIVQGENIAIVAPTGVGKTTLLLVYAIYRALQGARVYYLLPTTNLVIQVVKKIQQYIERLRAKKGENISLEIAYYHSNLKKKEKEIQIRKIEGSRYNILVTTTSFLARKWEILRNSLFDIILVDDVDSVLRNSKNIDRILVLSGFSENVIDKAYRLVKLKIDALVAKASGRMRKYEEILFRIKELETEIHSSLSGTRTGQIIIASATGRVSGLKPKVFRELAGFEIGRVYDYTRNVANMYVVVDEDSLESLVEKTIEIIKAINAPGLVFVSKIYGKKIAKILVEKLQENGINAKLALSGTKVIDAFAEGKIDVLVGISSYYGVIVRGIDLPQRVYYTLFVGVPAIKIDLEHALSSPFRITRLAVELGLLDEKAEIIRELSKLRYNDILLLRIALQHGDKLDGRLGEILEKLRQVRTIILEELRRGKQERIVTSLGVIELKEDTFIIPDAATYIQASGRASRLLGSVMTRGISIIVERDRDLIALLEKKLRRFIEKPLFQPLDPRVLQKELSEAKLSRQGTGKKIEVETSVIIVESPTKAKSIANFFGKPVRRRIGEVIVYETTFYNEYTSKIHVASIVASKGHLFDLTLDNEGLYGVKVTANEIKPIYSPIKVCLDCGTQFASGQDMCPRCGSTNIRSKESIIDALRKIVLENGNVYIATDPDTEGEKIAYDIYLMVKPVAKNIKRMKMHEITKREFLRALAAAESINTNVVKAQIVRRIEDRWIGFALSEKLWSYFGKKWLGAGRVQTPVLGWIVQRHTEWRNYLGYNVYIVLEPRILLIKLHYDRKEEAEKTASSAKDGVRVLAIKKYSAELTPLPPYTTESLLYDASRLLRYPSDKTMRIAQELFENGLITYHRTDSTYVSSQGISIAETYLQQKEMHNLFTPRHWGEPGHHEAIRPTMPLSVEELRKKVALNEIRIYNRFTEAHYRLYDLIFRRFIASQMRPSVVEVTEAEVSIGGDNLVRVEAYTGIIEKGHVLLAPYIQFSEILAKIREGDVIKPIKIAIVRGSTVTLYTHGDVVLMMKKKGIGRPSTYVKTIARLLQHGYIVESKYRKYLIPTKLGRQVLAYLVEQYAPYISENRTRLLYEKMDLISKGRLAAEEVVLDLYSEVLEILNNNAPMEEIPTTGTTPLTTH